MKVAIVHDWFVTKGGAERCVEQILLLFPGADVFTVVDFLPEGQRDFLNGHQVRSSFIQRLPRAAKSYRSYLPLMPVAIEQLDVTGYDLVISTSSAVAKGVITGPDQVHIAYTFSPIRYAWDLQHVYLRESGLTRGLKSMLARAILHYIRLWDYRTASGVDEFVAISSFIERRIKKTYGRTATIVYPPVELDRFQIGSRRDDFYVTASRMVPYKRMPMIVEAFRHMPNRRLVVIGDGPDMPAVRAAAGSNVEVLGRLSDGEIADYLSRAKAFIFAAEEDFGIAPLEAQACGTPVIAYGRGAALETIAGHDGQGQTGVFFYEQSAEALVDAIAHFETRASDISPQACRANAERFSEARFRTEFRRVVDEVMKRHFGALSGPALHHARDEQDNVVSPSGAFSSAAARRG